MLGITTAPTRTIHHGDALEWLQPLDALRGASVITSLPDWSEIPELSLDAWRAWFGRAAELVMARTPDDAVAIFFQSDIHVEGRWIDKSALVQAAADRLGVSLLFHKIVCRRPAGTVTFSRASYSHLIGFSRGLRVDIARSTADVLPDGGHQPGPKSMGVLACREACEFVLRQTTTRTIVDPFCGLGTVLAVANRMGMNAVGVDRSARMVRRAQKLALDAGQDGAS